MVPLPLTRFFLAGILAALFGMGLSSARAETTVTTDPVGYVTTSCTNSADTLLAVTLTRPPEYMGAIASTAAASGSTAIITLSGTPGWTANQFVYVSGTQTKTYYALLASGSAANPKEGASYTIVANDAQTLTVLTHGEDISAVPANTQLVIIPYWTLSTLFPDSAANIAYTPTTGRTQPTQILIPDYISAGKNLAASQTYYYANLSGGTNVGWRLFGDPLGNTNPHDDDILRNNGYIIVRNNSSIPASTVLTVQGNVLTKKSRVSLKTLANAQQDNAVSVTRPVDLQLDQLGLGPSDGSFVATTGRTLQDQLFVFDNSQSKNKSASATYYYVNLNGGTNVGWRLFGDPLGNTNPHDADIIPAGSAFIIRKAATASGTTVFWTNPPTY